MFGQSRNLQNKIVDWDAVGKEFSFSSASKFLSSGGRGGKSGLPSKAVGLGSDRDKKTATSAFETMPGVRNHDVLAPHSDEVLEGRIKQQALNVSSSRRLVEDVATFPRQGNVGICQKVKNKIDDNQIRKMSVAKKKTLVSRPKLCKSANLKGSINLAKDASVNKCMNSLVGREEMTVPDKSSNMNDDEACFPPGIVEALGRVWDLSVAHSPDRAQDSAVDMDDETEAPDEYDRILEERNKGEKSERVVMALAADADQEEQSAHDAPNVSSSNVYDDVKKAGDGEKFEQGQPLSEGRNVKGKSTERTETSLANRKQKVTAAAKESGL